MHAPPPGTSFSPPFTLRSVDVVVHALGTVHRGAWAQRYWSSAGCLYHHAYPVGFRATKLSVFGCDWECAVLAGDGGPVFRVSRVGGGESYEGPTPTRPWTAACVARRSSTRISGPLFFGFSDVAVQQAIGGLYTGAEMAAACAGGRPGAAAPSAEEAAAAGFRAAYGLGEATAMLLALTRALGGGRHASVASLEAWGRAAPEHAATLLAWALDSPEIPSATRRWPGWRQRIAPRLVAAVCGLETEAPAPADAAGKENSGPAAAAAACGRPPSARPRRGPAVGC